MATQKELHTAIGILQGKPTSHAMVAAGYSSSYADRKGYLVEQRLRAKGLLPSEEDVADLRQRVHEALVGTDGEHAVAVAERLSREARKGAPKSLADLAAILREYFRLALPDSGGAADVNLTVTIDLGARQ